MSLLTKVLHPFLQLIRWFYKIGFWANIILIGIVLMLLLSRAAFHSNYDHYAIQSIPDFYAQELNKKDRCKLKVKELHHYLENYGKENRNVIAGIATADKYRKSNEINRNRFFWFKSYFYFDFFFIFFLGIFLLKSIKRKIFEGGNISNELTKAGIWFFLFFAMSILLDFTENSLMLIGHASFRVYEWVSIIKSCVIGVFLLTWFFHYHSLYFKDYANYLLKSIAASSVSLVVIILILSLLTMMQQGITLVLDLFTDPFNSILFIVFLAFASLLLSHFPTYLYIRFYNPNKYQWIWSSRFKIPTIYYTEMFDYELSDEEKRERKIVSIFRHFIGTFFLMMMLYAFVYSWNRTSFKIPSMIINQFFIILGFIFLFLHIKLYDTKVKIRNAFSSKTDLDRAIERDPTLLRKYKGPLRIYLMLLILTAVMILGRLLLTEWDLINKIYTLIQLLLLILLYIIFREYRSLLKYRFGLSEGFSKMEPSWDFDIDKENEVLKPLINSTLKGDNRLTEWPHKLHLLGNNSNTVYYLYAIAFVGIMIPLWMIIITFTPYLSIFNGANYLLLFILLIYAVFIAIIKSTFYGENKTLKNIFIPRKNGERAVRLESDKKKKVLGIPLRYMGFISILLVIVVVVQFNAGSNLHRLNRIEISENKIVNNNNSKLAISIDEFKNSFVHDSTTQSVFAISAFGGGLKANYNTLKTIEAIQESTNEKFLNNTLSMSGVSGGGVGLANYYLMNFYMEQDKARREENIKQIGELDIVAIDLTYTLFHDLIRSLLPKSEWLWKRMEKYKLNKDRSNVAMAKYEKIISSSITDTIPYQKIHETIFNRGQYAPTLLMNTTSTKLEYGLGSSIDIGEMAGAINILKGPTLDPKIFNTLSYYNAVSTVNRFPFLSPAAKIENLGHFVDGGYFENSGILTTVSFLDKISEGSWAPHEKIEINGVKKKVVIVNFLNSKVHWINHLIRQNDELKDQLRIREKATSETGAVIGTMTGTEMLPNYFIELLESKNKTLDSTFEFIAFHIPYKVYMEDIIKFLDAEPLNLKVVQEMILKNNAQIDSVLMDKNGLDDYDFREWGAVEPALARKLSKPDRLYQDYMIAKHPFIAGQIKKIKELCGI